jgi:hypothetical protein
VYSPAPRPLPIQGQIQFEHVDPGLAKEPELAGFDVGIHQLPDAAGRNTACLGQALHLGKGGGRTDVRVQAAGGGGDQIGRNRPLECGVLAVKPLEVSLDAIHQLLTGRSQVGAAGAEPIVTIAGRRGPALKILRAGELLANQFRSDHDSVDFDQAAVRLPGEEQFCERGDDPGVKKTGEHRKN